jgi:hypothetical protein
MPAAVAVPLIIGAASTGASLIGAKMASNASHDAADQQANSANQARAYQQQASGQAQNLIQQAQQGIRYAPTYGAPQSGAYSALSQAMGLHGTPAMQTPYSPQGQPGGMVQMRAPTGEISSVPAAKVAAYQARGARLV